MNSNTHKTAQGQEREANGHFSLDDAVLLVETKRDARAARKHLGMEAIEFDWFWEIVKPCDNVSLIVVSSFNASCLAEMLIERHGSGFNVRFVDLEGETLAIMAKQQSSRLDRLIRNPWHMTKTSGSC